MTARLLDGKAVAQSMEAELVSHLQTFSRPPKLTVILIGDNGASATYVRNKLRACQRAGIECQLEHLPFDVSFSAPRAIIERCNGDDRVDGILLQLPLPPHLVAEDLIALIDPAKDVDGLTSLNAGKLTRGDLSCLIPPTALGIWHLFNYCQIETKGRHIVIVGRSNIVGRPLSVLLTQRAFNGNATVTLAHSATRNLPKLCQSADLLIAAIGQPEFFQKEHLHPAMTVIDVGIHRTAQGLVGDVSSRAAMITSARTPVPGGVGPLTVISLLSNVATAQKSRLHL